MPGVNIDRILAELDSNRSSVLELLDKYDPEVYEQLWVQEASLYREFVKALIGEDRLKSALDLARNGLRQFPGDLELEYRLALIHSRNRHGQKTNQRIDRLVAKVEENLVTEAKILSFAGKIRKSKLIDCSDAEEYRTCAAEAASFYEQAWVIHQSAFAAINVASLSLLSGELELARNWAESAIDQVAVEGSSYWGEATLGEAALILGNLEDAKSHYETAVKLAGNRIGDISAMRRNLKMLQSHVDVQEILPLLNAGAVVIGVGHTVDHPLRTTEHNE